MCIHPEIFQTSETSLPPFTLKPSQVVKHFVGPIKSYVSNCPFMSEESQEHSYL
jgi:hypothetical protein